MERRPLGRSGLSVPPLVFGCNVLGWTLPEPEAFAVLDALLEAGLDTLDTADVYSRWAPGHAGGESEAVIGRWMAARGNRGRVIVATKVGMDMGEGRVGLRPDYIARAAEDSLRRLRTDCIDLYQSHKDDPDVPQAETLGAFARLIEAGKIRAIGASNFSAERLDEALDLAEREGLPRYESVQPEYSLSVRSEFEGGLEAVCRARGIGVITFFSLAAGFLTGKYRSEADFGKSPRGARSIPRYMDARGMGILSALDDIAAARRSEPAAVALAWIMAKPAVTAPIASATTLDQVRTLVAATRLDLSAEDVRRLDEASA